MKRNTYLFALFTILSCSLSAHVIPTIPRPIPRPPQPVFRSPVLTTTAIIEVYERNTFIGIVLIERGKKPFGKALPGGKIEYGETVEEAVRREMMEEVGLELFDLQHSIEVTHVAKAYASPQAGDDAASAFVVPLDAIPWDELAFDHALILRDYLQYIH
jgi:8-oxo-dGTP diphosphatase